MLIAMAGLLFVDTKTLIYVCIALVGFGNSNIFPIIFSQAVMSVGVVFPDGKKIGGAPANFAFHVSQSGLESCAVSAIGDDRLGREIIDTFNASGLDYILEKVDEPTGTVQVIHLQALL